MGDKTHHLIASNLTIAFYQGQIQREPFFGEDKRKDFYSANETNRTPTITPKEVFSIYKGFLKMLEAEDK